jgi:hypothetical protein
MTKSQLSWWAITVGRWQAHQCVPGDDAGTDGSISVLDKGRGRQYSAVSMTTERYDDAIKRHG